MEIKYTTKYNIGDEVWVKHYAEPIPLIDVNWSERTCKTIICKEKILSIDLYINNEGGMLETYFVTNCDECCYIADTIEESPDLEYAIFTEDQIEDAIDYHKKEFNIDVEWIQ